MLSSIASKQALLSRLCFLAYRDIEAGEVIHWNPQDYAGWLQGRLSFDIFFTILFASVISDCHGRKGGGEGAEVKEEEDSEKAAEVKEKSEKQCRPWAKTK